MVGEKAWFGPRRFGWGWAPVSREGWIAIVGVGVAGALLRRRGQRRAGQLLGLALLVLCILKGTEPGGRRKLAEYRAQVGATSS
jgi:hypothetical protein